MLNTPLYSESGKTILFDGKIKITLATKSSALLHQSGVVVMKPTFTLANSRIGTCDFSIETAFGKTSLDSSEGTIDPEVKVKVTCT